MKVWFRVRVSVSRDGNAVGLTSMLDQWQFLVNWRCRLKQVDLYNGGSWEIGV